MPVLPIINRKRSMSPAAIRKQNILKAVQHPRSYTVEAICAIPHPVPTHALASSLCMTHLLTGSDDGYIRDYDIFAAVNGKNFLTAQQRHHCGVIEGTMKAGQLRCWWENPAKPPGFGVPGQRESHLAPVYSLLMHSDALWALSGSDEGHINLFTVRHDPGRLCEVLGGHRGHVSSMSMQHDEKGFFSAGWDGLAFHWDLNTGQIVRSFTTHGSQLAVVAVRPDNDMQTGSDAASDYDPLFDEPDADGEMDIDQAAGSFPTQQADSLETSFPSQSNLAMPSAELPAPNSWQQTTPANPPAAPRSNLPTKNMPAILDPDTYASYSPDLLMTASIDGQVVLWDRRVNTTGRGVGRLWLSEKTPPWCMSACWSADGSQIYAGRRNGTVDVWDLRQLGVSGPAVTPRLLKVLRNPLSSGVVSCVVGFPDSKHIACASMDNIRLWNVAEANEPDASGRMRSGVQFKIIPGHHGGFVSQMLVDPAARFLVSASSNRGWHGESSRTVFVHEIKHNS
ncbi:WD40 repeat-like protein [Punctularia strigosozonata HHB-11173 SS5]|uniref:WD40 repeat-like protein n=1 Tax=Punctularia strigosozonata (strain HHB-11173) TaxID=741275 RepID=UPI000441702F|nr:WD40 repeat-like protein [Punctularia strigosozonata HHB-11173 SS5]EIN07302.1 WD40 repeat-like protein [Punctularia strigosozonata HHB-11173 SS5]